VHRAIGGLAAMLMFQVLGTADGQDRAGPANTSATAPHPYDVYLAPGKGIPAQQIEGVYHHWNWMMMLNAGMIDTGADYILFKNGEVWRHPQTGASSGICFIGRAGKGPSVMRWCW